jgi:hypothetical protein
MMEVPFPPVSNVDTRLCFLLDLASSFPMDTYLREIFLPRVGQLSNDDCRIVHFYFGNDIPRHFQNDITSEGTLFAMEFLFDQGKIKAEDIAWLIDAVNEISGARRVRARSTRKAFLQGSIGKTFCPTQSFGPLLTGPLLTESDSTTSLNTILPTLFETWITSMFVDALPPI